MNLTHENNLLQEINNLSASGKIQDSVALTAQAVGSGLTAQNAEIKIQKLIPITRQRLSAAKFYLDAIENMNYAPYLGSQSSFSEEQRSLIDFSDSNLHVEINLLNPDTFPLIVFLILQGFFSNLVSLEDCIAKIINIAYDLIPSDERPSDVGRALDSKIPKGNLIHHIRTFHAINQDGKLDETGSWFNIAKKIRNELVHDDIDGVMISLSSISLSGSPAVPKLHFHNSFFPANTTPANTEMIAFCQNVYDETVNFVDECYRLIRDDLQHSGAFPV
ncbi:hypothetical protein C6503_12450 [Candidatus Poribacteria bacterium]|nr:MAG: hypothetical protein C6503_12450 [Candidatus Poribacteria bacterium]